ncbi:MAG: Chromosome partition protein Smc [Candidatus Thorarchaeota archaeon]|nr:MAG: Chromosome partition protein Smc [Candidatus Thorarchaeota archaeon]
MVRNTVRLVSVKLTNFLSFYKGFVEFDPGLTVILGPNGSGKTSIFHAVKFALGSNQRENRYRKWSDFIRHGASTAEVELTVETGNGTKTFRRRIDRDGIPRAYIDGKRVKASEHRRQVDALGFDIDNTLVFMPQERINALRDMDPIEVRKLVEEGTGLAVLRDRIALQEVEVRQSRQRLDSATLESQMVEKELEFLKTDLARLAKKRALQQDEQKLRTELKWASLDDIVGKIDQTRLDIEKMESGLSSVLEEISSLKTQLESEEEEASIIENQLNNIQQEIGKIEAKIDQEERRLDKIKDDSKQLTQEIRQLDTDVRAEKRKKKKLQTELRRASKTAEELLDKQVTLRQELEGIEDERIKVEDELAAFSEWNAERAEVHGTYKALQAEVQGKDVLIRSLRERLQIEEAELQAIESKWGESWGIIEKADEKELVKKKGEIERKLASVNEERFGISSRVAQLQKEIKDIQVQLSETSLRVPETVRGLKTTLEEHNLTSLMGPVVEMVVARDEIAEALEAVLSNDLAFAFITQDEAEYTLIEKIRDEKSAASPIILVETEELEEIQPPDNKGVIGWLWQLLELDPHQVSIIRKALGDYLVVENNSVARRVMRNFSARIVTLEGKIIEPSDKRTISYPPKESTGIVSTAPLQKRLVQAEKELTVSRKKLTDVMSQIEKLSQEREEVMDILSQVTRWAGTWEKRKQLTESIAEVEERIVGLDDELKELQAELGKRERELRRLDQSQPPERSRLIGKRSAIRSKLRELQRELSKTDDMLRTTEKNENNSRSELRRTDELIEMLSSRLVELRDEASESKDVSTQILTALEELRESKKTTSTKRTELKKQYDSIHASVKLIREQLVERNLNVRDSKLRVTQTKRKLDILENEHSRLLKGLEDEKRPKTIRPLETVRERLLRVQHLLEDYQDVTESVAVTEVKLKERLSKLAAKVKELQLELDEAENAVKSIRQQYHKGMDETLDKVEKALNAVLQTVRYTVQVRFELVRRDGEYGVEFRPVIKGDEYDSISAGSGGERSLIAIGLIMALQTFNPAPVYALDEVDTFLDATNTEMISIILHDASRRSQFIIFTPAKSTHLLKHADKRIGVVSPSGTEPSVVIESPRYSGQ